MSMMDYYRTDFSKQEHSLVDAYYSSSFILEAYEKVIAGYEVQARIKIRRLPHDAQDSNDLCNSNYIVRYGETIYAISANSPEDDGYENSAVYLFREEITVEQFLELPGYEYETHCIPHWFVRDLLEDGENEVDLHYIELM
jgi:hypothetical protein